MTRVYSPIVAGRADLEPLPLDQSGPMVGARTTRSLGFAGFTPAVWNLLSTGAEIQGDRTRVTTTDELRLVRDIGGTRTRFSVPLSWFALPDASLGDTLDADNSLFVAIDGADGVRIGRTAGARPLIAPAGYQVTAAVVWLWEVRSFDAGLVGRRLAEIESAQQIGQHLIVLAQRAAARPDAPTGVRYDGFAVGGIPGLWVLAGSSSLAGGTDTLWRAFATATYNAITGLWDVGAWTVVQAEGDAFHVQYSTDATTWSDSAPSAPPYYVRYRLADGSWSVHRIPGDGPVPGWAYHDILEHPADTEDADYRIARLDWSGRRFIGLDYEQSAADDGWLVPARSIVVPIWRLGTVAPGAAAAASRHDINIAFKERNASGFDIGYNHVANPQTARDGVQTLRLTFEAPAGGSANGTISDRVRIRDVAWRSRPFRLSLWTA